MSVTSVAAFVSFVVVGLAAAAADVCEYVYLECSNLENVFLLLFYDQSVWVFQLMI